MQSYEHDIPRHRGSGQATEMLPQRSRDQRPLSGDGHLGAEDASLTRAPPPRPSLFTEAVTVKKRHLHLFDIAALIFNKQVGTGIFTTPGFVLASTQGKGLSVLLWFVGGLYCALWYVHSLHLQRKNEH